MSNLPDVVCVPGVHATTAREFTLFINGMNDYHFERSNKMPFLILQSIYCNIIGYLFKQINVYTSL